MPNGPRVTLCTNINFYKRDPNTLYCRTIKQDFETPQRFLDPFSHCKDNPDYVRAPLLHVWAPLNTCDTVFYASRPDNLDNKEGQTASIPGDKYNFIWTPKGVRCYSKFLFIRAIIDGPYI